MWSVYLLATLEPPVHTYVGATIDIHRRLRQHNGEIKGGARATSKFPGGWYRVCYVSGFESEREALRFEWWWKRRSMNLKGSALERRQTALSAMMDEALAAGDALELQFE